MRPLAALTLGLVLACSGSSEVVLPGPAEPTPDPVEPSPVPTPVPSPSAIEPLDNVRWDAPADPELSTQGTLQPKSLETFTFEVPATGHYAIQISGKLRRVRLRNARAMLLELRHRKRAQNLVLTPGTYTVTIESEREVTDYAVQLYRHDVPNGIEREPNDPRAERLPLETVRRGILDAHDKDRLRFHLANRSHVRVEIDATGPVDFRLLDQETATELHRSRKGPPSWEGWLEAGEHQISLTSKEQVTWSTAVHLTEETKSGAGVTWSVPGAIDVAAYREVAQTITQEIPVQGQGYLSAWASDARVQVSIEPDRIDGSNTARLTAHLPADLDDLEPIRIALRAEDDAKNVSTDWTTIRPVCGGPLRSPSRDRGLPPALWGTLDVARIDRGATVVSGPKRAAVLLEGITPNDRRVVFADDPLVIDLVGDAHEIVGVVLDAQTDGQNSGPVPFTLDLSSDGSNFETVLTGELARRDGAQGFELPSLTLATHARLTMEGRLGAFSVLTRSLDQPLDIANLSWGGRFVRTRPAIGSANEMLNDEVHRPRRYNKSIEGPLEFVLGFEHQRTARLQRLVWTQGTATPVPRRMAVAASSVSAAGPWTPLGELELAETGTTELALNGASARYLRLTRLDEEARHGALPSRIQVFEQAGVTSVASVQAKYRGDAPDTAVIVSLEADDNGTEGTATPLEPGATVTGQVAVGEDSDFYRVEVAPGQNHVSITVTGTPSFTGQVQLRQADQVLPVERTPTGAGTVYTAPVQPGTVFVKVSEPPRTVALLWDQSGSVGRFLPQIQEAITTYVGGVQAGREVANLYPFGHPNFLLEEWAEDAATLQRSLNAYDGKDSSSAAEEAMLLAVREMAALEGTKAIVILTDADTPPTRKSGELWDRLGTVRPRVFSIELHRGNATVHQDRMQTWSTVDAGHYTWFSSARDLDVAFERMTCHLRRPVSYGLTATLDQVEPPEPGSIAVTAEGLEGHAVELVLDASGSMLQRLGGRSRITVAKDVLGSLITDTIPAGTPVALRVFGHRKAGSCDTDLEVPLGPLDTEAMTKKLAAVNAKNLAKTPIGASLLAVEQDLAGHTGPRLVILLTDGEETCDGDPAAAIEALEAKGLDVRTTIVGFAIDDARIKADFEAWARTGGGLYLDASNEGELGAAMLAALAPVVEVRDGAGTVVAQGVADGKPITVRAGTYTVTVKTPEPRVEQVTVEPGKAVDLGG